MGSWRGRTSFKVWNIYSRLTLFYFYCSCQIYAEQMRLIQSVFLSQKQLRCGDVRKTKVWIPRKQNESALSHRIHWRMVSIAGRDRCFIALMRRQFKLWGGQAVLGSKDARSKILPVCPTSSRVTWWVMHDVMLSLSSTVKAPSVLSGIGLASEMLACLPAN